MFQFIPVCMIGRFVLDICMLDLYEEWYRMYAVGRNRIPWILGRREVLCIFCMGGYKRYVLF